MFFSRMTVAARLYAGFGLILALLIVVTGVAVVKVNRIDQALRDNNNIHVQVQRYAINFRGSAHDRSIAVRDVVLSPTPAERDKEIATIAALADFYAQSATPLEDTDRKSRAGPSLPRLLMSCTPLDGGTPLPLANMPASAAPARGVTPPAAVVAA